jgi:LAO/AO transport system kinase
MHSLLEAATTGDVRALGKALSVIEDGTSELAELLTGIPETSSALLIGVTGPPGVGKSTTTGALISEYRKQGLRVAVLAVDPSSPVTGGALLGDRIRMQEHALDEGVFIRSMSSRGQLGGLSSATQAAAKVLDAVGFNVIIVETVGVGQSEVDVVNAVDTVVLVLAPGAGDGVQAAKAGILEIADVYVVNKADRDGAEGVVRELRSMIGLSSSSKSALTPEIVTTVATTGQGLADLVTAIAKHHDWAVTSGDSALRSVERAKLNLRRAVLDSVNEHLDLNATTLNSLSNRVASGELSTEKAVLQILQDLG